MTQPTPHAHVPQPADEVLTMFRIAPRPDNDAVLEVISRDDSGQFTVQRYALNQLMVCALRDAMVRELGHIDMPPLRPEYAALLAADPDDRAARAAAAEAASAALYREFFPAGDGSADPRTEAAA